MSSTFKLVCPPMAVRAQGWLPTSDRLTDELRATFDLPLPLEFMFPHLPDGTTLPCVAVFPQSLVTFQEPGIWQVEALTGDKAVKVYGPDNLLIGELEFPVEPVFRKGRHMEAQPVTSIRGSVDLENLSGQLTVTLPAVLSDPFPWWRGGALAGYVVRAVDCPASVEWQ